MSPTDPAARPTEPLFPRLPGGPRRMPSARVTRHQKARLEGAMVEAVARHGYSGTTLRELVALAGVSRSTFYENFDSKQDCFLATFDEIVAQLSARVEEAYRSGGDFRERLTAGMAAFMNLAVEEPAAASLAAVESLTLGSAGVAHRERAAETFELLIQASFDSSDSELQVPELTVRAIVGGIRGVTFQRMREGKPEELPDTVDALVEWTLRHQQPDSEVTRRAVARATRAAAERRAPEEDAPPGWDEPPDSPRSRESLSQRERIVRGAALVVVERGYEALSIPAISAAAGTSNQTFYQLFDSKREAFLAAFEILGQEALGNAVAAHAQEDDPAEAVAAGLRALLEHLAANPLFARLAFFELPTAGPVALDRAGELLDGFGAFLQPPHLPLETGAPLSATILDAIVTGIWAVIQHEIVHGRRESLPELAPAMVRIIFASFDPA